MSSTILTQFGTSLTNSFRSLFDFRTEFQNRRFSSHDEAAKELSLNWDPRFLPNFKTENHKPVSRQSDYFTLFSFGEAMSELLVGIEQLGAYDFLKKQDFDQFASFVCYTSSFHLIDSFLCLGAAFFIPSPVEDCTWVQDRVMAIREARGRPMYRLDAVPLRLTERKTRHLLFHRTIQRSPRYLIANFEQNEVGSNWSFTPGYGGSVHVSRWRSFGENLKSLIRTDGADSIPRPVRQFFGLFRGHLADLGLLQDESEFPLDKLIDYGCIGVRFEGITTEPFAPKARNLAIYKNQTIDDYLRRVGPALDPSIIEAPSKVYPTNFHALARGMAAWQLDRLTPIISNAERELPQEVFLNGMRSALLFADLVELDYEKIVDSPLFDTIPLALRNIAADFFRDRRYIPARLRGPAWEVGTQPANIHFFRAPITIPAILTPQPDWLPNLINFL